MPNFEVCHQMNGRYSSSCQWNPHLYIAPPTRIHICNSCRVKVWASKVARSHHDVGHRMPRLFPPARFLRVVTCRANKPEFPEVSQTSRIISYLMAQIWRALLRAQISPYRESCQWQMALNSHDMQFHTSANI